MARGPSVRVGGPSKPAAPAQIIDAKISAVRCVRRLRDVRSPSLQSPEAAAAAEKSTRAKTETTPKALRLADRVD
eukprot:1899010-Rhodomonas_salina.1